MARISPITAFVRGIPGDFMTLAEVARILEIPEPTLRDLRIRAPKRFGPSLMTHFGRTPVYLYSAEDLERVRVELKNHRAEQRAEGFHSGRPALWTATEAADRRRRSMQAVYYARRADQLASRKLPTEADAARARAEDLRAQLKNDAAIRTAQRRVT